MAAPDEQSPLHSIYADDPEMADLLRHFASVLPERLRLLEEAMTANDIELLSRMAHQLKGASGGYGFHVIGDAAATLERLARASMPTEALRDALDELKTLCGRVRMDLPRDHGDLK